MDRRTRKEMTATSIHGTKIKTVKIVAIGFAVDIDDEEKQNMFSFVHF